jgi:hypothetical protein
MLIYFDESYDNEHKYLLLGALFNPHPGFLHREWLEAKRDYNFISKSGTSLELKYNNCTSKRRFEICCKAIDIFMKSTSYFRSIVINQEMLNLECFGRKDEMEKIKMARAYKKFAELLLSHNTEDVYNGVLLTDELKRCRGDKFVEIMKNDFCTKNGKHCNNLNRPTLKHIMEIKSHVEEYHVNQINDILLGSILNNLIPTKKEYKNNLRNYLIKQLGIKNLLPEFWNKYSKRYVEEYYSKFNIWYWKPGGNQKTPENSEVF